ncbi:MAG TPA: DUF6588 family protein [Bacteroidota bacterium]|nr:DUF6588 family protein [Bacteroidota bacterium]
MRKTAFLYLLVIFSITAGFSQSGSNNSSNLNDKLGQIGSGYAQSYLQPIGDAFGADINSGFFHTAHIESGFHLYFGIKGFAANVPDADKTMSFDYNDPNAVVTDPTTGLTVYQGPAHVHAQGPSVFGSKDVRGTATFKYTDLTGTHTVTDSTISGLVDASIIPLGMPQVTVGSIFGTDFTLRYIPSISLGDYGSIGFWGFGVRHSISQYLGNSIPVDIAVQLAWQSLTIQDSTGANILKTSAFLANAEVSKSFSILTLYGALQKESSSMDISYKFKSPDGSITEPIAFSLDAKNTFRVVVGATLGLGPLTLNADYDAGSTTIYSGGLGFSF